METTDELKQRIEKLKYRVIQEQENTKRILKNWKISKAQQTRLYNNLKEQLKNAIVPKFNKDEEIFYINDHHVFCGDVIAFNYYSKKYYILSKYYTYWVDEDCIFATEAEAQKYLEEHK